MDSTALKINIPNIPIVDLSMIFNKQVISIFFIIFIVLYLATSSVLYYHWTRYGMRNPGIIVAQILFLFVSISLFILAGLALTYY